MPNLLTKVALRIAFRYLVDGVRRSIDDGDQRIIEVLSTFLEPYQAKAVFDAFYTILYENVDISHEGKVSSAPNTEQAL